MPTLYSSFHPSSVMASPRFEQCVERDGVGTEAPIVLRSSSRGDLVLAAVLVSARDAEPLQVPHQRWIVGGKLLGIDPERDQQLRQLIGGMRPRARQANKLPGAHPEIVRGAGDLFRSAASQFITQPHRIA